MLFAQASERPGPEIFITQHAGPRWSVLFQRLVGSSDVMVDAWLTTVGVKS